LYLTGIEKKLENAGVKLHNLYSSPYFSEAIELDARDKGANIMHVGEEKCEKSFIGKRERNVFLGCEV
jgi:hypothetical protein